MPPSSQELGESTLPSDSLCQMLAVSAMWRQKFLQPQSWRLVLKRNPLMMRLSGLMCEPSTASRGAALWMASLADSRARIIPSPDGAKESLESTANSGTTSAVALARFSQNGCIWKMCRESLWGTRFDAGDGIVTSEDGRLISCLPDSGLFLETWPLWGSMRNGYVYQQPKLGLRTNGLDGSAWPTARAEDSECCGNHRNAQDSLGGATVTMGL